MGNEIPLDITLDNDPQQLLFSGRDAGEIALTITNNDSRAATDVLINITRADLLNKGDLSLSAEELAGAGYQMINETWFECRAASPDAWVPVDDWTSAYSVGSLAASASASFEVRINTPALAADYGRVCFAIMISSKPADVPQVQSVLINEASASMTEFDTTQFTVTVTADIGADETVTWSSSDDSICTVDATGLVTGISGGRAIITAVSNANPIKKSSRFASR